MRLIIFLSILLFINVRAIDHAHEAEPHGEEWTQLVQMKPGVPRPYEDMYMHMLVPLDLPDEQSTWITKFEPAQSKESHHMIFYLCSGPIPKAREYQFEIGKASHLCTGEGMSQTIIWAWAYDGTELVMPDDVGFMVGGGVGPRHVLVEVHYKISNPLGDPDPAGVKLTLTTKHRSLNAGLILFMPSMFQIPPNTPEYNVTSKGCNLPVDMHVFAIRVHAHAHGVTNYAGIRHGRSEYNYWYSWDPQKPQTFMPQNPPIKLHKGDRIFVQCKYQNINNPNPVDCGPKHSDEMCNLYVMFYREPEVLPPMYWCSEHHLQTSVIYSASSMVAQDRVFKLDTDWSNHINDLELGQVSGVAVLGNQLFAFTRADHAWLSTTFDNQYRITSQKKLSQNTIYVFDLSTSETLNQFGANLFALPHGITVAASSTSVLTGDLWVTDVGLHQVFKLSMNGEVMMTLGIEYEPGTGGSFGSSLSFCQPADVAIYGNWAFIADGYCNQRVVWIDATTGQYLSEFPTHAGPIVHSLAIHSSRHANGHERAVLFVANRQMGELTYYILSPLDSTEYIAKRLGHFNAGRDLGGLLYAVEYEPLTNSLLVVGADRSTKHSKIGVIKFQVLDQQLRLRYSQVHKIDGLLSHDVAAIAMEQGNADQSASNILAEAQEAARLTELAVDGFSVSSQNNDLSRFEIMAFTGDILSSETQGTIRKFQFLRDLKSNEPQRAENVHDDVVWGDE